MSAVLNMDDNDFIARIGRAGDCLKTFGQQVAQTVTGLGKLDGSYASLGRCLRDNTAYSNSASQALAGLQSNANGVVTGVAKTSAEVGRMSNALKAMGGDPATALKGAQKSVLAVVDAAAQAPAYLKAAADSFAGFASDGIEPANGSLKDLMGSLAEIDGLKGHADIAGQAAAAADAAQTKGGAAGPLSSWQRKALEMNISSADTLSDQRDLRRKLVDEQIADMDRLAAQSAASADKEKITATDVTEYQMALNKQLARDNESVIDKTLREWSDYGARLEQSANQWLTQFSDKLVDFAITGKITFADFAETVLKDILRIQYQMALAQSLGPDGIGGLLFSGIKGLWEGATTPSSPPPSGDFSIPGSGGSMVAHGGGVLGQDVFATRMVPGSLFENAQRFHSGRAPVLRSDEVPTILQKDEGVFTPAQMKALARGQGGTAVQVNLINQSGQQMAAEQGQPRFDGEQMVLDIVLRAASRPGNFRDSMKGALS